MIQKKRPTIMHSNERTIVGCYEKKLCRAQICTWSCAHLASRWRPLCPLLCWWLRWHCWCCPLCCRSHCRSCWCLLCVRCTGIRCAGACRAGVCHAGVPFVVLACLLCWCVCRAGMVVVLAWSSCCCLSRMALAFCCGVYRAGIRCGCGFVVQVWHSSYWYSSWVLLDSLP